ncbi:MAG: SWIM zinc finger family protein [Labilithrix sp.]|nr:SWIM zinc finger family protein [Labilithrix sp.]MCW5815066.1 SWIM zinc finger family protein [Labilithrix sp.]
MARGWYGSSWRPYVPVAKRRVEANKEIAHLRKQGRVVTPIAIEGTKIAATFWGKAWCTNLESYSDYESRLPRGRSYVRNGSVLHLEVLEGKVEAIVRGSDTYTVTIAIKTLPKARWRSVVERCSGQVGSLVELLRGKMPREVMEAVCCRERGLFPSPQEIRLTCSCPDWATMCKHVAAVMYGVGARLDVQPDLLFRLRAVDPSELLSTAAVARAAAAPSAQGRTLDATSLGDVFGIDMDEGGTELATRSAGGRRRRKVVASPVAAEPAEPTLPRTMTARITLAELANAGVTMGELADLVRVGTLAPAATEGTYRTTPDQRATLIGAPRRRARRKTSAG